MPKSRANGGRNAKANVTKATKTFKSKKSSESKTKTAVAETQRQSGKKGANGTF